MRNHYRILSILLITFAFYNSYAQPGDPNGGCAPGAVNLYTLVGSNTFCAGTTGITISLSGSQTVVSYQLTLNGTPIGSAVTGTGTMIIWGVNAAGTYTVVGTNAAASCTKTMTGSATITFNPLPNQYTVSGGGGYAGSGAGLTVNLSNSDVGVSYQLKKDGTNSGTAVSGTGSALAWTNLTAAGAYTVIATGNSCSQLMNGSAAIELGLVPDAQEFQALKAIYDSLGGSGWTTKTNWPTPGNWPNSATAAQMGTWYGITVTSGDVTTIFLSGNHLVGKIPSAIGNLTALSGLAMYTNSITGKIPSSIGNLTKMINIRLYQNQLTGAIPPSIGNLTKMTTLYLMSNNLTSIPAEANNLVSLTYLNVSTNALTSLPNLGNLQQLTSLLLQGNGQPTYNTFNTTIPSWVYQLTKLQGLYLSGAHFNGSISPDIGNLTALTWIDFSSNQLTGTIPSTIGNLSNLSTLLLNNNQLSGTIPSSIGNLTNLTTLNLGSNQLSGSIPNKIGNLSALTTLNFGVNQLSGPVPSDIGGLINLTTLNLNWNQLSGSIPSAMGNLVNVTDFELANNQLSGTIPESLGNLVKVRYFYLYNNKLTGALPATLGNMVKCAYLRIENNQLSGQLPNLSRLSLLYQLILNGNQLSGEISSSLLPPSLGDFQVSSNKFTGPFPDLSAFPSLANLVLDNNGFSGDFPSVSSNILLNHITATNNNFKSIPTSVINLSLAGAIYFSNNLIATVTNLAIDIANNNMHPNSALTLKLDNNKLDFSQLEVLKGLTMASFTYSPQKTISDTPVATLTTGTDFIMTARPKGAHTSNIKWEKLQPTNIWLDFSGANADPITGATYRIANATTFAEGTYRWSCTSSTATGFTLMSDPIVVKTQQRAIMDDIGFQYKYDGRKRMIAKKVPGADWVYMVYDDRDRLVLTQDGNQRPNNQWTFTKYDVLNRPVMTGIYTNLSTFGQAAMQALVNSYYTPPPAGTMTASQAWYESFSTSAGNIHNYDDKSFPQVTDPSQYLTVTYYDNYSFISPDDISIYAYVPNDMAAQTVGSIAYSQPNSYFTTITGHVAGTKTRVLDTYTYWLKTVNYYDDKYRVVQTIADDQAIGQQRITNIFDFAGKTLATKSTMVSQSLTWQNIVNSKTSGDKYIATLPTSGWGTSGGSSLQQLAAGQDGWMETTVVPLTNGNNNQVFSGLSQIDPDANYTSINYAWSQVSQGAYVHENGVMKLGGLATVPGDVLRIERTGTVIKYKKNGVVMYTSTTPSTTALIGDVAFYSQYSVLLNARSSFSPNTGSQILRTFEYDHASRLTKTWHSVNSATPVLLSKNEYNELGQLIDKRLHSTDNGNNFKQSVDYRYNIRGWLTSINNSQVTNDGGTTNDDTNDLFGMNLGYNQGIATGNTAMYNGNISGIKWSSNMGLGTVKDVAYNYGYDTMNRIKSAAYLTNQGIWTASNNFAENGFCYDMNGNIKKLARTNGAGSAMDNLTYTYKGNQLVTVTDAGDVITGFADGNIGSNDYTYDANGNMTADNNKNITAITYNYLNLPQQVTKKTGEKIIYTYDAGGRKLRQQVYNATGVLTKSTDYNGEFIYQGDTLQFINHEEGRVLPEGAWIDTPQDNTQLVPNSDANSTTGFLTVSTATMTAQTIGSETYLKLVSNVNGGRPGVWSNWISVQAGQQYQLKVKGYRTTNPVALYVTGTSGDLIWPGPPIPAGAGAEDWVTTIFTVPLGVYSIQVGALWNGGLINDIFYINKIELYKYVAPGSKQFVPNGTFTYQYHLKDHLGNVRLTFTTKNEVDSPVATFETANYNVEQSQFLRMDDARLINSTLFDHTHNGVTSYSERLSGTPNEVNGVARSISVMPGDTIKMEVFAKYVDPNNSNNTPVLTQFLAQIVAGTASAGTVIDGANYSTNGITPFDFSGLLNYPTGSTSAPKAYLNYLVFDRNLNFMAAQSGYVPVSTAAKEDGTNVAHEWLHQQVVIAQPGYVYIYLSNDNVTLGGQAMEVYFDDFKVTQVKSPVVQSEDFYPFGLSFNFYQRENIVPQNYLYNSKELQKDLGVNWEDYGARMYQPELGRFFTQDRFAEMYYPIHPYQYAANNPVMYIDYNGDSLMLFKNGAYVTTVDNGKKEMTGFNQESKTGKDGKEEFTGGQSFDFNDYENDGDVISDLRSGNTTLNVLSNKDVDKTVEERSGAGNENVLSRWGTAWSESPAGGKMDFSISPNIKSGTLNIINGSAYNEKDAGNYMWGYAMRKMGYTTTMARLAAHVHAWSSGKQENGQESTSTNPIIRWWENKTWGGDSEADQRAIIKGMNAAGSYWSNKKKSLVNLFK